MKKNLFTLSALCLAAMTLVFSGCKKENNDPQEPAQVQTYQMSITASKGADSQANGPRRVLSLDGNTLNAAWAENEEVTVYNTTKGAAMGGTLKAETSGASTQLTGELTGTIEVGDKLTLKFLAPSYAEQEGTLAYISANCDYAIATDVEVTDIVDETIYTDGETTFENQQAVVEFTLQDKGNNNAISASELVVKVGTATYTVKPDAAASKLYVAIPGFAGGTVTLTATVGSDTYTYEKTGVTFANGKFYQITAKLTKQAPAYKEYGPFSVSPTQKVNFSQGNLQYQASPGVWRFAENQYDYVGNGNANISPTYNGWIDLFGWATSNINNPANTNYQPWNTGSIYDDNAKYGSGITAANVNWSDNNNAFANYDWGANTGDLGTGWRTLTKDEWGYLFNTRTGDKAATVNGTAGCRYTKATINTDGTSVKGIILFPDGGTFAASEFTAVGSPNTTNANYTTTCTTAQWTALQTKGCVFLPAAGRRFGTTMYYAGDYGNYWSSSASSNVDAYRLYFNADVLQPENNTPRCNGYSVRLVKNAN